MEQKKKGVWELIEEIMHFFVFRIFHIPLSEQKWQGLLQFIKFGIVGLSNTVISYVVYLGVLFALQRIRLFPKVDYLIASVLGFLLSVLWSFYWNNKYVFQTEEGEQRSIWKALLKTYVSYAFTGLFLNSILSIIWVEVFHWSKMIAPIINLLISVPLNYVMNKFWAFRKEK